jgi:hypothetical protein
MILVLVAGGMMIDPIPFAALFPEFLVLIVMGFVCLIFFMSLRVKFRALRRFPSDPQVKVFDKTFSVFDPYPERRKMIQRFTTLFFYFAGVGSFLFLAIVTKMAETGLILGAVLFILCIGLMMLDEMLEIYKNACVFVNAVREGADFGKGDLIALSLVRQTLPKLSNYYLLLAIVFFASSTALPYIVPAALLALSGFVGLVVEFSASAGMAAPYIALLFLGVAIVIVQIVSGRLKSRILGFPQAESLSVQEHQFEQMRIYRSIQHHHPKLRVPEPQEKREKE